MKKLFLYSIALLLIYVGSANAAELVTDMAEDITIEDAGGYYVGTEVETALQEIVSTILPTGYLDIPCTTDPLTGSLEIDSAIQPQLTVGRSTDGYVGLLLERAYVGKWDWYIKNAGNLEIYSGEGSGEAGGIPATMRVRINDTGKVDALYGMSIWNRLGVSGEISTDSLIFDDGQTGDSWYWMGTNSDNGADDDDSLMIGKGITVGTTPYLTISPTGDFDLGAGALDTTGTGTFGDIVVPDGGTVGATTNKWLFDDTNGDISTTGNVGIGTTSPQGRLHIDGGMFIQDTVTIPVDDTTPLVSGGNIFVTSANTVPTAITDLDSPQVGQIIYIIGGSDTDSSTIADSGNFNLSAAWTANLDDVLVLLVKADNSYVELSRSNN